MANSKKEAFYEHAERMFVEQGSTRENIAERLGLGEKTVRIWAIEGGWEGKKAALMKTVTAANLGVYEVIRKYTVAIQADLDAGTEVSKQRIDALAKLVKSVGGLKKYEDQVAQERVDIEKKELGAGGEDELIAKVNDLLGA